MLRLVDFLQKVTKFVAPGAYSRFTSVILQLFVNPMSGTVVAEARVQNRVSGHEKKPEKAEREVQKENGAFTKKGRRGGELVTRCGRESWKFVLSMSTTTQNGVMHMKTFGTCT